MSSLGLTLALLLASEPSMPLEVWKFRLEDSPRFASPDFDDSKWEEVRLPHQFKREHCRAWYRAVVEVPPSIGGVPTAGGAVALKCFVDDGGEVYVNGRLENRFAWDGGMALLTERAKPGQRFVVAIRAYNAGGPGGMGNASLRVVDPSPARLTVNLRKSLGPLRQPWRCLSQGGGFPDYSDEVAGLVRALGVRYIRMDHVLDLLVGAVEGGRMRFFWDDIDRRVEFVRRCGAEPIMCLSYMPRPFLRDPRYPLVSPPKDWDLWEELVYQVVRRFNVEKGRRIRYWEVWNEPNSPGFWRGDGPNNGLADYLRLYEASAKGALRADPTARIGGPGLAGGPWRDQFCGEAYVKGLIEFCAKKELPLDFVSWHEYWHPPEQYVKEARLIRSWLSEHPRFNGAELIVTEWSFSWGTNMAHDCEVGAAWMANTLVRGMLEGGVDKACYFLVQDIPQPKEGPFQGWWGLITRDRRPKASYFVLKMFSMLDGERLEVAEGEVKAVGALAASDGRALRVLVWHYASSGDIPRAIILRFEGLPEGKHRFRRYLVDMTHSNIYHDLSEGKLEAVEEGNLSGSAAVLKFVLGNYATTLVEVNLR